MALFLFQLLAVIGGIQLFVWGMKFLLRVCFDIREGKDYNKVKRHE